MSELGKQVKELAAELAEVAAYLDMHSDNEATRKVAESELKCLRTMLGAILKPEERGSVTRWRMLDALELKVIELQTGAWLL